MRYLLIAILLCGVVLLGATALGRAIDQELQQRILITQNGVTLDCERITDIAGNVFYDSCVRVP